jgi:hypothetical protein
MNIKSVLILLLLSLWATPFLSQGTTLVNQGAFIRSMPGSFVSVNGSVLNNPSGQVFVNGDGTAASAQWYVTEDITNQSTITADGYIRLLRHWINNGSFVQGVSTVFMEGGDQFLEGTTATTFHNLTLLGTGIKTQKINKSSVGVLALNNLHLNTDIFTFFVQNPAVGAITRDVTTITGGFVSSANGGFLSRVTNSTNPYLFPVGSTANNSANTPGTGTTRYRPVILAPKDAVNATFVTRLANLDATVEGFSRASGFLEPDICATNPLFYHQINRSTGTSLVDLTVHYVAADDGLWQGLGRWEWVNPSKWGAIPTTTMTPGTPFNTVTKTNWNGFGIIPYILINARPIVDVTCANICPNTTTNVSSTVTPSGTYTYNWTVPVAFSPNPGNVTNFDSGIPGTYGLVVTDPVTNCTSILDECTISLQPTAAITEITSP